MLRPEPTNRNNDLNTTTSKGATMVELNRDEMSAVVNRLRRAQGQIGGIPLRVTPVCTATTHHNLP